MTPAPQVEFVYTGTLAKIIDGDTFDMMVDLGFRCYALIRVRLHGIDVFEHGTPQGEAAKIFLLHDFQQAKEIKIQSYKDVHSFERWVCDVWLDGQLLSDSLRAAGFAKPVEHLG